MTRKSLSRRTHKTAQLMCRLYPEVKEHLQRLEEATGYTRTSLVEHAILSLTVDRVLRAAKKFGVTTEDSDTGKKSLVTYEAASLDIISPERLDMLIDIHTVTDDAGRLDIDISSALQELKNRREGE